MGQTRRTFTDEFKAAAVGRLYKPGATQGGVAKELGVTSSQLKTWRLEIEAAGSMAALRRQQADAAELDRLRKENKRLKLENEILEKASAFFASRAAKT
ncbi:transposase [Leisingera sp. ANG59]|uniref:transposase n=1 Tax=Leisingera sp. ANG59 TaxID=2675221 RepID=UPI0015718EFF|nr:transposase [Leisingera sp. ANG59]NSY40666.1 transposase [Leisingera sp. ANG59]